MSTTTRLMTAEELFELPDTVQGSSRFYELIRGELRTMSPTGGTHGILVAELTTDLTIFVRAGNLGYVFGAECGFKLAGDPDTVVAPDISFVHRGRLDGVENVDKFLPLAPDLAIEVLSPSNTVAQIDEKIEELLAAGTEAVWIVNPKRRTITVYRARVAPQMWTEKQILEAGEPLPGFRLDLAKLFAASNR